MLKNNTLQTYYKRKLIKVFPIYWFSLLVGTALLGWGISPHELPYILLLQSWIPFDFAYFKYLGVSWFLSSLLFCYVVSPYIYGLVYKRSRKVLIALLITLLAASQIFVIQPFDEKYHEWPYYICPLYCLAEYMIGLVFGKLIKDMPEKKNKITASISWIVLVGWIISMNRGAFGVSCWYIHLLLIWCLYIYNTDSIRKVLGNKYCQWFGQFFMPIYLIHQAIINWIQGFVGNAYLTGLIAVLCGLAYGILWKYRKKIILNCT